VRSDFNGFPLEKSSFLGSSSSDSHWLRFLFSLWDLIGIDASSLLGQSAHACDEGGDDEHGGDDGEG